jgi:hypothetical protein
LKITDADGEDFWVTPSPNTMDIEATMHDGRTISIEVKATRRGRHDERMDLHLSGGQLDAFANSGDEHSVVLAIVHNALATPEITYFLIGSFEHDASK